MDFFSLTRFLACAGRDYSVGLLSGLSVTLLLVTGLLVTGCGQQGPLVRAADPPAETTSQNTEDSDS